MPKNAKSEILAHRTVRNLGTASTRSNLSDSHLRINCGQLACNLGSNRSLPSTQLPGFRRSKRSALLFDPTTAVIRADERGHRYIHTVSGALVRNLIHRLATPFVEFELEVVRGLGETLQVLDCGPGPHLDFSIRPRSDHIFAVRRPPYL